MVQRANRTDGSYAIVRQLQVKNVENAETMDEFIFGLAWKQQYCNFLSCALQRNADLFPQVAGVLCQ